MLPSVAASLRTHATDLLALAGVGCVVWGVASIYRPAGWIVAGLAMLYAWWNL